MVIYIGLDIGKESIHYAFPIENESRQMGEFPNTVAGIQTFLGQLPQGAHGVMEATGLYHFPLAYALEEAGFALTVLNPLVSSAYSKSLASISKTDKSDAVMLQRLAQERNPQSMRLPDKNWQAFRHKMNHLQNLQVDMQKVKNRIKHLDFHPHPDQMTVYMLEEQLELLEKQHDKLYQAIQDELPQDYEDDLKYATSIKGIGTKTATFLLLFTRGLQDFQNPKQLAKYIGIAPMIYQSGNYRKKGRITKKGNPTLRSLLYNCAKSAKRFNTACQELYDKLRSKGKAHKVAMVAVMHKLLRQFFACVKNQTMYQDIL